MHLGGSNTSPISCLLICDFWCSANWRVERDAQGCEVWRFDLRRPAPGETMQCLPERDAAADHTPDGHGDSGGDRGGEFDGGDAAGDDSD
jgi:hypothetical protein